MEEVFSICFSHWGKKMFSAAELEVLKKVDVPLAKRVEIIFNGTAALDDYARTRIRPLLIAVVDRTDHETALTGAYYRMCLHLESLVALNNPRHLQAVCGITRSLFELLLDIKELVDDSTLATKYLKFTLVERFRAARLLVSAARKLGADAKTVSIERTFLSPANRQRVYRLRRKYWLSTNGKLLWPSSWNGDTAKRSKRLGRDYELKYRTIYPRLSWYSHGTLTGFGGISPEGLEAGFGWAHVEAQKVFNEATELLGKELRLFAADTSLAQQLREVNQVLGKLFIEASKEAVGAERP